VELQGRVAELGRAGRTIVALSYDSPDVLRTFATAHGITFPLLSDPGSAIIRRYGLLNTSVAPGDRAYGVPFPGTFVLDGKGRIVARHFEENYRERNTAASIEARLVGPTAPGSPGATTITTPHLTLAAYPSDGTIAPGSRFSLILDVTPGPSMHVYAPPQEGYGAIALTISPREDVVVHPMTFPEAETYHFKPLNEHVRVYQRAFRLMQDVTFAVTPETRARASERGGQIRLEGRLEYQACDDKVCYLPQSIPLSWTIGLRPLVAAPRR
jgi:AhpC/TSA family/Disulphide bond corrector protein DsbC